MHESIVSNGQMEEIVKQNRELKVRLEALETEFRTPMAVRNNAASKGLLTTPQN